MSQNTDLIDALQRSKIEARFDLTTRILYSTDASIYQVEPLGVVFPRHVDDLATIVSIASQTGTPVLARGSGSSLAGQAIGQALIVDCSRYLDRLLDINPEEGTASVEPGVILTSLNKAASRYRLQFGPDPASAERATLGGSLSNNATGAHSILHGMAADHLISAEVILADGSPASFEPISLEQARWKATQPGMEGSIYQAALDIRDHFAAEIKGRWPRTWRRAAGYNLNYLLPWSPTSPPGWSHQFHQNLPYPPVSPESMNLAPLLAGAEGTLAMIQSAKVRLVPLPKDTILGILAFRGIAEACDAAVPILELDPSAIELIPGRMIDLARSVPAFASQLSLFDELHPSSDTPDLLVVEFAGEDLGPLQDCTRRLGRLMGSSRPYLIADTPERQKQVWSVRKVGLGLLASAPGERKTVSFIEDLSVPVEQLGTFVREMDRIFKSRGTRAEYYAHASAGCLHIRPLLDLKSIDGVASLRLIASEAIQLTIRLGGSVSGEHGMGMARSEWMSQLYGDRIMTAFRLLKNAADPRGSLNPGKILDPPKMDENLRYGTSYQAHIWSENLNFKEKGNLVGAIELCNGAGVCRKLDGVMCPSFQATREEMHSTRGRANLLRAMISHPSGASDLPEINRSVFGALDLCLACKGCKAECPSAVDMAKLKYEFLHHYYQSHRRRLRDYIFAFIGPLARIGQPFVGIINPLLRWRPIKALAEKWLGISARRQFPVFSAQSFHQMLSEDEDLTREMDSSKACLLLPDAFLEYMYPEVGIAAVRVLRASGYNVCILPVIGAGRTMLSKGFLDQARSQARRVIDAVERLDPEGKLPVVGLEPSEIYTLRDEFLNLLPGDPRVASLAQRAWMIDEFLVRPAEDGRPRLRITGTPTSQSLMPVQLHGHCYQKAQGPGPDGYATGTAATQNMLEMCGYAVATLNTGCCGMAGAFGYEVEHYDLSIKVGELSLFPSLRDAVSRQPSLVAASGVSCKAQIEDGLGQPAYHPIQLVARVIP